MTRPSIGYGMRHVALFVRDLAECERFYVELLGMQVEWRPDEQNVYLTSGGDNLALHQADPNAARDESVQRLDHIGFFLDSPDAVDQWFAWLRDHGARSFYCYDPDGTLVQMIHHPPVSQWESERR